MTITTAFQYVPDEVGDSITLDAPKYIAADARHVSRLLKAAGLKRAERSYGGNYSFGYHVSANQLTTYGDTYSHLERSYELLDQATEILRDKGFVVTGTGSYRQVFKLVKPGSDDEATFWQNLHRVYVAVDDDRIVSASVVPVFLAEKKARNKAAADALAAKKRQEKARKDRCNALVSILKEAGLDVSHNYLSEITVDSDALYHWLLTRMVNVAPPGSFPKSVQDLTNPDLHLPVEGV